MTHPYLSAYLAAYGSVSTSRLLPTGFGTFEVIATPYDDVLSADAAQRATARIRKDTIAVVDKFDRGETPWVSRFPGSQLRIIQRSGGCPYSYSWNTEAGDVRTVHFLKEEASSTIIDVNIPPGGLAFLNDIHLRGVASVDGTAYHEVQSHVVWTGDHLTERFTAEGATDSEKLLFVGKGYRLSLPKLLDGSPCYRGTSAAVAELANGVPYRVTERRPEDLAGLAACYPYQKSFVYSVNLSNALAMARVSQVGFADNSIILIGDTDLDVTVYVGDGSPFFKHMFTVVFAGRTHYDVVVCTYGGYKREGDYIYLNDVRRADTGAPFTPNIEDTAYFYVGLPLTVCSDLSGFMSSVSYEYSISSVPIVYCVVPDIAKFPAPQGATEVFQAYEAKILTAEFPLAHYPGIGRMWHAEPHGLGVIAGWSVLGILGFLDDKSPYYKSANDYIGDTPAPVFPGDVVAPADLSTVTAISWVEANVALGPARVGNPDCRYIWEKTDFDDFCLRNSMCIVFSTRGKAVTYAGYRQCLDSDYRLEEQDVVSTCYLVDGDGVRVSDGYLNTAYIGLHDIYSAYPRLTATFTTVATVDTPAIHSYSLDGILVSPERYDVGTGEAYDFNDPANGKTTWEIFQVGSTFLQYLKYERNDDGANAIDWDYELLRRTDFDTTIVGYIDKFEGSNNPQRPTGYLMTDTDRDHDIHDVRQPPNGTDPFPKSAFSVWGNTVAAARDAYKSRGMVSNLGTDGCPISGDYLFIGKVGLYYELKLGPGAVMWDLFSYDIYGSSSSGWNFAIDSDNTAFDVTVTSKDVYGTHPLSPVTWNRFMKGAFTASSCFARSVCRVQLSINGLDFGMDDGTYNYTPADYGFALPHGDQAQFVDYNGPASEFTEVSHAVGSSSVAIPSDFGRIKEWFYPPSHVGLYARPNAFGYGKIKLHADFTYDSVLSTAPLGFLIPENSVGSGDLARQAITAHVPIIDTWPPIATPSFSLTPRLVVVPALMPVYRFYYAKEGPARVGPRDLLMLEVPVVFMESDVVPYVVFTGETIEEFWVSDPSVAIFTQEGTYRLRITPLQPGKVLVAVKDTYGCVATAVIIVESNAPLYVPDARNRSFTDILVSPLRDPYRAFPTPTRMLVDCVLAEPYPIGQTYAWLQGRPWEKCARRYSLDKDIQEVLRDGSTRTVVTLAQNRPAVTVTEDVLQVAMSESSDGLAVYCFWSTGQTYDDKLAPNTINGLPGASQSWDVIHDWVYPGYGGKSLPKSGLVFSAPLDEIKTPEWDGDELKLLIVNLRTGANLYITP